MPKLLFPHNEKAYRAAVSMMNTSGKAAIVHPTGTGKSFIAFQLVQDNPGKRILWLSPSEYIFKTQCESVRRVNPTLDLSKVRFLTYAKLTYLNPVELAQLAAERPAYIIFDEFHRAGATCWGEATKALLDLCHDAKLLGLSATSIRYLDDCRDMAEELFDGHIASEMTLGGAIVRGILPTPTYVTTVFKYQSELEKYQRRIDSRRADGLQDANQKYLEALRRALEQADGLDRVFAKQMTAKNGKYIVFCSSFEHMREMISYAQEWFAGVNPEMHIYKAYSSDPETSKAFADFKADESDALKLLYCIDMLNEGIHVSGISGVILFRPTISPIIYKQQIGRALTSGDSSKPLILDIVNNFDGLTSIAAIQEEMNLAVQRMTANGEGAQIVTDRFEVQEQVHDCRLLFEQLQNSLSNTWEQYFAVASVYAAEFGNLRVPKSYVTPAGIALGSWILYTRLTRRGCTGGKLTPQQIARLDGIGMVWDNPREIAWENNFAAAEQYYEEFGNLLVPVNYVTPDGVKLGEWLANTRAARKEGRNQALLTAERVERLNAIGMAWNAISEQWERNYAEAVCYYNAHGNLQVPARYKTESGFALGSWLRKLRRTYEEKQLSNEQIERLEAIGMKWGDLNELQWNHLYECAKQYFEKNGDLNVPLSFTAPGGEALGRWVARQRSSRKNPGSEKTKLAAERITKLDAIGMDWGNTDPWEHRYQLAAQYKKQHGNLQIPAKYKTADGIWLGNWLYHQRQRMLGKDADKKPLTEKQCRMLAALDMPTKLSVRKPANIAGPRTAGVYRPQMGL